MFSLINMFQADVSVNKNVLRVSLNIYKYIIIVVIAIIIVVIIIVIIKKKNSVALEWVSFSFI